MPDIRYSLSVVLSHVPLTGESPQMHALLLKYLLQGRFDEIGWDGDLGDRHVCER